MIEKENGSLRVEGTDTVSSVVFNQVFDSLDRLVYSFKNIHIITSSQVIATLTPSTSSNFIFYINMYSENTSSVTANIFFQDNNNNSQTYNILDSYATSKNQYYSFNPIFLSTNTSPISVVCSGISTSFSLSIEKN
jgi:hypothetical protein